MSRHALLIKISDEILLCLDKKRLHTDIPMVPTTSIRVVPSLIFSSESFYPKHATKVGRKKVFPRHGHQSIN